MRQIRYLDKLSKQLKRLNDQYNRLAESRPPKPIPGVNLPWSKSSKTDLMQVKKLRQEALFRKYIFLSTGPFVYDYLRLKEVPNRTLEQEELYQRATETLLNLYMGNVSALDYLEKVMERPWIGMDIVSVHQDLLEVQAGVMRMKGALT